MNRYSYKNLNVYQDAKAFVVAVYKLLDRFPDSEKFALCNQIRRAVISVPSNIAEGLSRTALKEQAHFLDIAYGSLMEIDCQLDISLDLGYISKEMRQMLDVEINSIGKMIRSLKSQRTNSQSPIAPKNNENFSHK